MPRKRALTGFSKSSAVSKRRRAPAVGSMSVARICRSLINKNQTFVHRGIGYLPVHSTLGWNSAGPCMVLGFTQNQAYYSINGAAYATFTGPYGNASPLTSVFDQFRCVKIQADMYFSASDVGINQPTYAFPMCYAIVDEDDANTIGTVAEAISYTNMKTFQMIAGKKMSLTANNPSVLGLVDSITAGASLGNATNRRQWLSTASNSGEFGWFKFYLDTANMSAVAAIGTVSIMFTVVYEYRNTR